MIEQDEQPADSPLARLHGARYRAAALLKLLAHATAIVEQTPNMPAHGLLEVLNVAMKDAAFFELIIGSLLAAPEAHHNVSVLLPCLN